MIVLLIFLAWSDEMPAFKRDVLAQRPLGGLLDLAVGDGLQGHLPADELLLEDLDERLAAVLGRGVQLDLVALQLEARAGVLEVEAGRDLPARLVDGVAHLLHIDLGGDIEARHGAHAIKATFGLRLAASPALGRTIVSRRRVGTQVANGSRL